MVALFLGFGFAQVLAAFGAAVPLGAFLVVDVGLGVDPDLTVAAAGGLASLGTGNVPGRSGRSARGRRRRVGGLRWGGNRRGERISTAVVESMVNRVIGRRMAKGQQMRWSRRGAHLLVQVRLAVLEGNLQKAFRRWYPGFQMPLGPEASPT